jgi:hypothetical protein
MWANGEPLEVRPPLHLRPQHHTTELLELLTSRGEWMEGGCGAAAGKVLASMDCDGILFEMDGRVYCFLNFHFVASLCVSLACASYSYG